MGAHHGAFPERVALLGMSSFGKVGITVPGALPLLERVAGSFIARPAGTVIYTQLLAKNGGITADVTITRISPDHFRLVTGAGYVNSDIGWLRLQTLASEPFVSLSESAEELSVIGMWGPHPREVLQRAAS